RRVPFHGGVVVDEDDDRRPCRVDAEPADGGESDVGSRRNPPQVGMFAKDLVLRRPGGVVHEENLGREALGQARLQRREPLEQVLGAAVMNDDDGGFGSEHAVEDYRKNRASREPSRRGAARGSRAGSGRAVWSHEERGATTDVHRRSAAKALAAAEAGARSAGSEGRGGTAEAGD